MNRTRMVVFIGLLTFTGTSVFPGPPDASAQGVRVLTSVNETTIGSEDPLVLMIEVRGASYSSVETPEPPPTEGLALVQRIPSTQRHTSIINGRLEQSVSYRWTYRPVRVGEARIGSTDVLVEGTRHATTPIRITVVSPSARPRTPQATDRRPPPTMEPNPPGPDETRNVGGRDLFIRVLPSKRSARVGEQITIEYKLFFREGVQLRHSRMAGSWDAEGFWREEFDVDSRPVPSTVVENGLRYRTITLKRAAFFPTRPGTLTIDPLRIETDAFFGAGGPFEQFFSMSSRFETVPLASPALRVEVQPLPSGAPESFEGAVGSFAMEAVMTPQHVEVGEPVQVRIALRGTGNLATLRSPALRSPGVFERFDADVTTTIRRDADRLSGEKMFTYVLVPRSNGEFAMPPVSFAYFQPDEGRYVTLQADLGSVRVTGSPEPLAAGTTSHGLPIDDIATILTRVESWKPAQATPFYLRTWPYLALLIPPGLLFLLLVWDRRARRLATDVEYARGRLAHPLARKHLRRAEALLKKDKPREFYEEIDRAVTGFIGNRLNVAELGLTRKQIDERLACAGVEDPLRQSLQRLLEECDRVRFAPLLPDREVMTSARERAARLIVGIDAAIGPAITTLG